jgi:OFA family oxalate/formate antiporter-like MFS transporter
MGSPNRWSIAVAGVCLQMSLGAAYAWSVFRIPLSKQFGWSIAQVSFTFTISFFFLGCTAVLGGLWMSRKGPRVVAMAAGLLWGGGVFLASFSAHKLWWLYLTYGVIGGAGLGMGYIVPLAVLVKWFPERRGLITGIAVGGFGAGSLLSAPLAGRLIESAGLMPTFAYLGVALGAVAICSGFFMRNPPEGWRPPGWVPTAAQIAQRSDREYTLGEALRTWQWWALCGLVSINTMAGLSVVSQASPMFQEIGKVGALAAASLVGFISIGNGLGRVLWAWISDITGRKAAFLAMYLLQAVLFWTFPWIHSPAILTLVIFILVVCYGGGYGITPAFTADYFGARNVGAIYGLILLPWAFPAAFGPLLFAYLRESTGGYDRALYLIAGMLTAALVLPILMSPPRGRRTASETRIAGVPLEAVAGSESEA